MKTLTFTTLLLLALAATGFGRIGENEKEIEARYGKAGKDLGTRGAIHEVGYMAGGYMILVDFVNGISKREGFANPDTSALSVDAIKQILAMSSADGTNWQEQPAVGEDRSWRCSDNSAIAIFPARGKFLFIQDVSFVQPK
jgi:hypothetical protein